jgi:hypothetical protein
MNCKIVSIRGSLVETDDRELHASADAFNASRNIRFQLNAALVFDRCPESTS